MGLELLGALHDILESKQPGTHRQHMLPTITYLQVDWRFRLPNRARAITGKHFLTYGNGENEPGIGKLWKTSRAIAMWSKENSN